MGALQGALRSPAAVAGAAPVAPEADSTSAAEAVPKGGDLQTRSAVEVLELLLPENVDGDELTDLLCLLDDLGLLLNAGGSRGSDGHLDWSRLRRMIQEEFSFFTALAAMAPEGQTPYCIDFGPVYKELDAEGVADASLTDATVEAIVNLPVLSCAWPDDQICEFGSMNFGSLLALIAAVNNPNFLVDDLREPMPARLTSGRKGVQFLLKHRSGIQVRAVR
jgi:hypothetical protein